MFKEVHYLPIPHKAQRYSTVGDWWVEKDILELRVSDTGNQFYNLLVAIHELTEALLCIKRGVKEKLVTKFDVEHPELDDPGWDKKAPYHREHIFAEVVERLLCGELGIDWLDYENAIEKLYE